MRKSWRKEQRKFLRKVHKKPWTIFIFLFGVLFGLFILLMEPISFGSLWMGNSVSLKDLSEIIDKNKDSTADEGLESAILRALDMSYRGLEEPVILGYRSLAIDSQLQGLIQKIFERYKPAFASAAVVDASNGRVLALVGYPAETSQGKDAKTFLPLNAQFPAASIFKLVTASAAIENSNYKAKTRLRSVGNPYRLYPKKFTERNLRRGRRISLQNAFAKSDNVAFADLTKRYLNKEILEDMAFQFGFDRPIPFPVEVEISQVPLPDDSYKLAESSTGLGKNITLSPFHGALMAAAIANEGKVDAPTLFLKSFNEEKQDPFIDLDPSTARIIGLMMKRTITRGTARKTFRGWKRSRLLRGSFIGGKTGSLNCENFGGRCDWFIGFGKKGRSNIALSVVMVNRPIWHIKPPYVARKILENQFREEEILTARP